MHLRFVARFVVLFCGLLLAGCAALPGSRTDAPPRETLDTFVLEGRFSLRHEAKNYSGRLSWRHVESANNVLLSSPFGQGIAEISSDKDGARLTMSDGRVFAAPDAETLTNEVLGYPLPLAQLADWVRGRAGAGLAEQDSFGRLLRLRQDGWRIDYEYDNNDPQAPPVRLFAERAGGLELRLRIDEWNRIEAEETKP